MTRAQDYAEVMALSVAAKAAGASMFYCPIPCAHGHVGKRFTTDRKCCECNRIACKARNDRKVGVEGLAAREANRLRIAEARALKGAASAAYRKTCAARQSAIAGGDMTYRSHRPCPKDHDPVRYTTNGACVECGKENVREQNRLAYFRERYEAKKPQILREMREYRARNPEPRLANVKAWQAANPEKVRGYKLRNKHKRRAREGGFTQRDITRMFARQRGECAICATSIRDGYHVDHVIALTRGGTNWCGNLQLLCASCNQHKSDKLPIQYRIDRMRQAANDSAPQRIAA